MTSPGELSASALLLALRTVFDPAAATDGTIALRLSREWFTVTVAGTHISIVAGRAREPDATLETDAAALRSVAFGRELLGKAERDGRVRITGDRAMAERFTHMFPAPAATP